LLKVKIPGADLIAPGGKTGVALSDFSSSIQPPICPKKNQVQNLDA
jgi:hypothetical protein